MERERLAELMETPGRMTPADLAALRDLGERFPWFSGAHLLRAVGEQATHDVLFEETLRDVAAHIPLRTVLYDAVHVSQAAATPAMATPEAPPVEMPAAPEPFLEAPKLEEVIEPTPEAPPSEPAPAPPTPDPASEELDLTIRTAALASSYEFLLEHGPAPPIASQPKADTPVEEAPAISVTEKITEPPPPPPAQQPAPDLKHRRMAFTAWLEAPPAATRPAPEPKEPAVATTPSTVLADPLPTTELIDRFISQSTPAPKPKATFFTPQQAAKRSLDDTAGLVTETLARVHVKQGNLAKAIEAYGKLALKYPERSAYFAALQKELEVQLRK